MAWVREKKSGPVEQAKKGLEGAVEWLTIVRRGQRVLPGQTRCQLLASGGNVADVVGRWTSI